MEFIEELLANEEAGTTHIMRKAQTPLVLAVIWLVTFAGITAASFDLLMSEDPAKAQYQFIPVLAIVGAAGGITLVAFAYLRNLGVCVWRCVRGGVCVYACMRVCVCVCVCARACV